MIGIVTDSNSQIPDSLVARFGVEVVPLTVTIDGVDFLEGIDLDADGFYAAFEPNRTPTVSTSQPSPGQFLAAYETLAAKGCRDIVSIHVTASMSGTLGSAHVAAARSPVPVHLVDTTTASFGITCCVWAAGLAVERGASVTEVVACAESLAPEIGTSFVIGVPRLARSGGRVRDLDLDATGIAVVAMHRGAMSVLAHVHTIEQAVTQMHRYASDWGDHVNVAIGTSDTSSQPLADAVRFAVLESTNLVDLVDYRIGPSVGAHTGPGTAGLFVFPARIGTH